MDEQQIYRLKSKNSTRIFANKLAKKLVTKANHTKKCKNTEMNK